MATKFGGPAAALKKPVRDPTRSVVTKHNPTRRESVHAEKLPRNWPSGSVTKNFVTNQKPVHPPIKGFQYDFSPPGSKGEQEPVGKDALREACDSKLQTSTVLGSGLFGAAGKWKKPGAKSKPTLAVVEEHDAKSSVSSIVSAQTFGPAAKWGKSGAKSTPKLSALEEENAPQIKVETKPAYAQFHVKTSSSPKVVVAKRVKKTPATAAKDDGATVARPSTGSVFDEVAMPSVMKLSRKFGTPVKQSAAAESIAENGGPFKIPKYGKEGGNASILVTKPQAVTSKIFAAPVGFGGNHKEVSQAKAASKILHRQDETNIEPVLTGVRDVPEPLGRSVSMVKKLVQKFQSASPTVEEPHVVKKPIHIGEQSSLNNSRKIDLNGGEFLKTLKSEPEVVLSKIEEEETQFGDKSNSEKKTQLQENNTEDWIVKDILSALNKDQTELTSNVATDPLVQGLFSTIKDEVVKFENEEKATSQRAKFAGESLELVNPTKGGNLTNGSFGNIVWGNLGTGFKGWQVDESFLRKNQNLTNSNFGDILLKNLGTDFKGWQVDESYLKKSQSPEKEEDVATPEGQTLSKEKFADSLSKNIVYEDAGHSTSNAREADCAIDVERQEMVLRKWDSTRVYEFFSKARTEGMQFRHLVLTGAALAEVVANYPSLPEFITKCFPRTTCSSRMMSAASDMAMDDKSPHVSPALTLEYDFSLVQMTVTHIDAPGLEMTAMRNVASVRKPKVFTVEVKLCNQDGSVPGLSSKWRTLSGLITALRKTELLGVPKTSVFLPEVSEIEFQQFQAVCVEGANRLKGQLATASGFAKAAVVASMLANELTNCTYSKFPNKYAAADQVDKGAALAALASIGTAQDKVEEVIKGLSSIITLAKFSQRDLKRAQWALSLASEGFLILYKDFVSTYDMIFEVIDNKNPTSDVGVSASTLFETKSAAPDTLAVRGSPDWEARAAARGAVVSPVVELHLSQGNTEGRLKYKLANKGRLQLNKYAAGVFGTR